MLYINNKGTAEIVVVLHTEPIVAHNSDVISDNTHDKTILQWCSSVVTHMSNKQIHLVKIRLFFSL